MAAGHELTARVGVSYQVEKTTQYFAWRSIFEGLSYPPPLTCWLPSPGSRLPALDHPNPHLYPALVFLPLPNQILLSSFHFF